MAIPVDTCTLQVASPPRCRKWRVRLVHRRFERLRIIPPGDQVTLGSGPSATVTLDDPTVSSLHCRLEADEEGLTVVDLQSKNGLFVGGTRVGRAVVSATMGSFVVGETTVFVEEVKTALDGGDLGMVGDSQPMKLLRQKVRRFACLRAPVLVLGETGTGKDLVARALHAESKRSGPYFPLNVAALSDALVDSELFGHTRGAFTGALAERPGAFCLADGGTLFLDELAELSASAQAKLLRVVEDGAVRAVGGDRTRKVKTRLVTATCAPLAQRVAQGRFREDLFHRISTLIIEVPPLRHRRSDIPLLVQAYLRRVEAELGQKELAPSALALVRRAEWPGNVRQLFACLYRAAAVTPGATIGPAHLEVPAEQDAERPRLAPDRAYELLDTHGNVSAAARAAGVPRSTFRSVLARHARSSVPRASETKCRTDM